MAFEVPRSVTYDGNGNTSGTVPVDSTLYAPGATVTVLGNTGSLVRTGHTFAGWNTTADGSGTRYAGGATFNMGSANVTLFAEWSRTNFSGNSATGSGTITASLASTDPGCGFGVTQLIPVEGNAASPPAGSAPAGSTFPHGLFTFTIIRCAPGSTVDFTITYPHSLPEGTLYWKYGPETVNITPHWYVLKAFSGNSVTFSITDGQQGDDDLAVNGTIVDQGGPGVPAVASVPALSQWALALMALLMLGIAACRSRD